METQTAINETINNAQGVYGSSLEQGLEKVAEGGYGQPAFGWRALDTVLNSNLSPVKWVLKPFAYADPLRRGNIAIVNELGDLIDMNPKSKVSAREWLTNVDNVEYGFGKAFPVSGWKGRFIGLLGDIVLDPINWATLGGGIPETAAIRIGTKLSVAATKAVTKRVAVEGAEVAAKAAGRTSLRAAMGGRVSRIRPGHYKMVRIHTLETRTQLAKVVVGQQALINAMTDAELLAINATKEVGEQLVRRSQAQMDEMEQLISTFGKMDVPIDLARDIGLPKAGVYYAGSRIKVPFTGGVANVLERRLVNSRVFIQRHATGPLRKKILAANITQGGLDALTDVKNAKLKLLTGKDPKTGAPVTPQEARVASRLISDSLEARVVSNMAEESYRSTYNTYVAKNPTLIEHKDTIYKIIDKSNDIYVANKAAATDPQRTAVEAFEQLLKKSWDDVFQRMKTIDDDFQLGKMEHYFPHMPTQAARKYMDDVKNPHVAELRAFLKKDAASPSNSFSSRTMGVGAVWFGKPLTIEDLEGGIETLNRLANEAKFVGNFFETDAVKVLGKYGKSYGREMGRAHFLEKNFQNGNLAHLVATGQYDEETLQFLAAKLKTASDDVTSSSVEVSLAAKKTIAGIDEALRVVLEGKKGRGGELETIRKLKVTRKGEKTAAKSAEKSLGDVVRALDNMVEQLIERTGLVNARNNIESHGIGGVLFDDHIRVPLNKIIGQIEEIAKTAREYRVAIANGTEAIEDFDKRLIPLRKQLQKLDKGATALAVKMRVFDAVHAHLGEFINGRFSELAAENLIDGKELAIQLAREGFGTDAEYKAAQNILGLFRSQSSRDKLGLTIGGRLKDTFKRLWPEDKELEISNLQKRIDKSNIGLQELERHPAGSYTTADMTEAADKARRKIEATIAKDTAKIQRLTSSQQTGNISTIDTLSFKRLLDPKGVVSQNQLKAMSIAEVRRIITTVTSTEKSIDDLHRAIVWLIIRDVHMNESIISDVLLGRIPGRPVPAVSTLANTEGSVNRINNMVNIINDVNKFKEIRDTAGRTVSGKRNPKIPTTGAFSDVTEEINSLGAELMDVQQRIISLTDTPISRTVKEWDSVAIGRESEVVINQQHARIIQEMPDILAFRDMQDLLRQAAYEGKLTYGLAKDTLDDMASEFALAGEKRNIPELVGLQKRNDEIMDLMQKQIVLRDNHLASLSSEERDGLTAVMNASSHAEIVHDFSDNVLEYYIFSDTKHQFNNLMDELAPFGLEPSDGIYQRLYEQVAGNILKKVKTNREEFSEVAELMSEIRVRVQGLPASQQSAALREEFQQLFKTEQWSITDRTAVPNPKGEMINRVFPEIRPLIATAQISDFGRMQAYDETLIQINNNIIRTLKRGDLMRVGGQGRVKQRAGYMAASGDDAVPSVKGFDADIRPIDKITGLPIVGVKGFGADAYRAPRAGIQQVGINDLLAQLGGRTVTTTKGGVTRTVNTHINIRKNIEAVRMFVKNNQSISETQRTTLNIILNEEEAKAITRLAELRSIVDAQKKLRKDAGLPVSIRKAQASMTGQRRLAQDTSYNYGLSGKLNLALNSNQGWTVKNFFSDLLGGDVRNLSSGQRYRANVPTERIAKNQAERYKNISYENSYVGTVESRIVRRRAALEAMMDPEYPIDVLKSNGSVAPSLTGGDLLTVESKRGYADILATRANDLRQNILANKEFAKTVVALETEAKKLFDNDIEQNYWIAQQLKREQKGLSVPLMVRYAADETLLIKDLPKSIQRAVAEMRDLVQQTDSLAGSTEYLVAHHNETLHKFLLELSRLNMDELVNVRGETGVFFESSGTRAKFNRVWNAPTTGENIAPTPGALNLESRDNTAVSAWASAQNQDGPAYRSADELTSAYSMKEVPFDGTFNRFTNEYLIKSDENVYIQLTEGAFRALPREQYSRVISLEYKPLRGNRKNFGTSIEQADYLRNNAQPKTNSTFNPNETWYKLEARAEIKGARQTASENAVVVGAKPEVWVKYSTVNGGSAEPIINSYFTPAEWEAVFRPELKPVAGKVAELRNAVNKLEAARLKVYNKFKLAKTQTEKTALLKQRVAVDARYEKATKELELFKSYGSGMRKVNELLRTFEDKSMATRLGVAEKAAGDPLVGVRKWVTTQLDGYGGRGQSVAANESVVKVRLAQLHAGWTKSGDRKYVAAMAKLQARQNDIAFTHWASSIYEQYNTYRQTIESLNEVRGSWTNQNVIDNADAIIGILNKPVVSEIIGEKGAKTAATISERTTSLRDTGDAVRGLLAEEFPAPRFSDTRTNLRDAANLVKGSNAALESTAKNAEAVAKQLRGAPMPEAVVKSANADAIRGGYAADMDVWQSGIRDIDADIANLDFEKLLKMKDITAMEAAINNLTAPEKLLLKAKAEAMKALTKIDNARMKIVMNAAKKVGIVRGSPTERLLALGEQLRLAESSFDQKAHVLKITDESIVKTQESIDLLKEVMASRPKVSTLTSKRIDNWMPDVKDWIDEAVVTLENLSTDGTISPTIKKFQISLLDAEAALHLSRASMTTAQSEHAVENGLKRMFDATGINMGRGKLIMNKSLMDGYELINKDNFPNVIAQHAIAEILRNAQTIQDPNVVSGLHRTLQKWNSYWKPLATTSPGFHARNNYNNVMAMALGGATVRGMGQGTDMAIRWFTKLSDNVQWEDFVKTLTEEEQYLANGARYGQFASGGGAFGDIPEAENIVQRRWVVKKSRGFGVKSDDFARFVFSYDAMVQGFSPEQAGIRTKRFYFDYQDVSTVDEFMRLIVPFWMWTSRNTITQFQNMWMNPRAYAKWNSVKRNFSGDDDDEIVPRGWAEMSAIKLPFGKDLYAIPDIGPARYQQQLAMLQSPSKFLGDVNPMLRVPLEIAFNKKAYTGGPISKGPLQTSGYGVASALQPLAQKVGLGQTGQGGQKFINPYLLYFMTALNPPLSVLERMNPSQGGTAEGGFNTNAAFGWLGSPIKKRTPEMENNELLRRLFEMQKMSKDYNTVNYPEG